MKKILIIGSGGAGKSTIARRLSNILSIPVYHLDALFWKPGWEQSDREEFRHKIQDIMMQKTWILDGNFNSTMEQRLEMCDTVIFLHYSRFVCTSRAIKRRLQYANRSRPDMTEGCKEKLDMDFLKWIWFYNDRHAPVVMDRLNKTDARIIILQSPSETAKWLNDLSSF
ncbi:DNA topology modulation protein [Jeotgalibacillus sp. R-1-5s-1]|uniref:DNA topology modulation protein n=1 Tax=Jeotgalibacillus sp. R-1-5s-1 TaxID=2555897 RepID=UPI00106C2168|nr:DNA topology modulation protein [Jeotgalibacillus sp. R-1-5s-1]TFE02486.1 DNA topology modulation protein [Jeotgalibacillus sp. R-1-5s-1]